MYKVSLEPVNPSDPTGLTSRHRTCRLVLQVGKELIRVCWVALAKDGSASFGLAMGDTYITETGSASIKPDGTVTFIPASKLDNIPIKHRKNAHVTLHPSGVCHVRVNNAPPVEGHQIEGWFPVTASFVWLQAFTEPVRTLPRVAARHSQDAVLQFPSLDLSARIQAALFPRTTDVSVPLVSTEVHTLCGIGPHYFLRLTVDDHQPVFPTIVMAQDARGIRIESGDI